MALYVYAVTRDPVLPECDGVDQTGRFGIVRHENICAVYTKVDEKEFGQEAIDARAKDIEWLGAIGYRHQGAVADLIKRTAIVPLRAFTLFSTEEALLNYLAEHREPLDRMLQRLDGKQEWTLRIEFEPEAWSRSLIARVDSLRALHAEAETATTGKAFLLRKKLDDAKKRASREAEQQVVAEIERAVLDKVGCETVAETRQERDGAFPQIDVLINRDEESRLQELHDEISRRYAGEGITVAITGPWPPYTFAKHL
ncbi:MAG TPA: GvpL/GvpF family gas vesicle protein [Thermoanaerobaculia bacterium]|nr:GvpL/GvpF family gas vesicle protein [Thermoanaerobaculia bacterium]